MLLCLLFPVCACVCVTYYLKKTNAIYLCFFITFKQQQDDVCQLRVRRNHKPTVIFHPLYYFLINVFLFALCFICSDSALHSPGTLLNSINMTFITFWQAWNRYELKHWTRFIAGFEAKLPIMQEWKIFFCISEHEERRADNKLTNRRSS